MPMFTEEPIQQDDKDIVSKHGIVSAIEDIQPTKDRILGKRLTTWEHKGLIKFPSEIKTEIQGRVEIIAIGPKVREAKVGEIAFIGQFRDFEFGDYVIFQEDDIRVIIEPEKENQ